MTVYKGVGLLLISTMAAVSLTAATPAHAATGSQDAIATAWRTVNFQGDAFTLEAPTASCNPIYRIGDFFPIVFSAKVTAPFGVVTLYRHAEGIFFLRCVDPVSVIPAGTSDSGLGTKLGMQGARYYSYRDF